MTEDDWPLNAVPMQRDRMDPGLQAAVKRRAREIWEQEGRPQGKDTNIWLRAELDILGQAPPLA